MKNTENRYELEELVMMEVANNKDYKKEYECNPLFHEIIEGITNSDDVIEAIVNTLYSYNQMLTNISSVIANNADDESVNKVIKNLESQLEDNKE